MDKADKAKISYGVRYTRAPGETSDTAVPVINERLQPSTLADVIENCIDRGLIVGPKPNAAESIADAIASQMAYEFKRGRGVKFGNYFRGLLFLNGTVGADERLTSANSVNVRMSKSEGFKLGLDDFSFTFDGSGDLPKIKSILCDGVGTNGVIVKGQSAKINGVNLYAAGDTVKVYFKLADGTGEAIVVDTFTATGAELLAFVAPASLQGGKQYKYWVERTDANGISKTTDQKTVAVQGGNVPAPRLTEGHSQAHEAETGKMFPQYAFILQGDNLQGASVHLKYTGLSGTPHDETLTADNFEINEDGTELVIGPGGIVNAMESTQIGDTVTVEAHTAGGVASYEAEHAANE